ncbi:formimidoylglutamase [Halobacillus halophilus]|uniref:formimidoylglutamase n=1 Tax=Halobacillus halophilus TaxID=1570 RepID=UPI00136E315B|nr:formimidoylglutamase [Halobacillus halophilus]MYL29291.1 formimidoylglutamase [Halobacillus halophilus]
MSFRYLSPGPQRVFKDRFTTKVDEKKQWFEQGRAGEIGLLGLPYSKSSISVSQASEAPQSIRRALGFYTTYSLEKDHDFTDVTMLDFGDAGVHPTDLERTTKQLQESVKEMLDAEACSRYILLGGDHGVSFPSISAFHERMGRVGVLQWDAHHDVRNTKDGGRTNGTPFRSLLESGALKGEDLVQIGIRDYSNAKEYGDYCARQGVTVYTMADVEAGDITSIVKKEIQRLKQQVDVIYLSVDMDVVDQAFAPGCPAIGPGGLTSRELLLSVQAASCDPIVKAMDIVEVDPSKDFRDMTSRLAAHVMMRYMFQ